MVRNILFICGSLNQTTMMHQIAQQLSGFNCFFTPFYADGILGEFSSRKMLEFTILGGKHRRNTVDYLCNAGLPIDEGGRSRNYDVVFTCTDLIIQRNISGKKIILVQEGITEPEGLRYQLVRWLGFPRFIANTAATGLSYAYDLFCVASPGYRDLFIRKGAPRQKITVTGIPNFDHFEKYRKNDFPFHNYVLVATSNNREVFKPDNRMKFLQKVRKIADGRKVIFRLHPNENALRAKKEIGLYLPESLVYEDGNTNHMIANCDVLVTQTSSVTFVGLAMGKKVYSDLDLNQLRHLMPIQNDGTSALNIAELCRNLVYRLPVKGRRMPLFGRVAREKIIDSV